MSDSAVMVLVSGLITITTMIVGFLTLWVKLKYGADKVEKQVDVIGKKVDANTEVTLAGTSEASYNARVAAKTASVAATKVHEINTKLNGELDEKIAKIVGIQLEPLYSTIKAHVEQDDKNMVEIRTALGELRDKIK